MNKNSNNENRGGLEGAPFSYSSSKDGKVFVFWFGKQTTILKGKQALSFLSRVEGKDEQTMQLEMAKITGNFKRGNERPC